jgi:hypothetical protein
MNTMKERPILFSAPMVRAILEGRKTQTRRIVKPQPMADHILCMPDGQIPGICKDGHRIRDDEFGKAWMTCPHGQSGDRLWVRETHRLFDKVWTPDAMDTAVQYRADMRARILSGWYVGADEASGNWSPSIFMRRWMSRITLEITVVRVERLQDISEADAAAEGVVYFPPGHGDYWQPSDEINCPCSFAYGAYMQLWESINGAGSWAANPWVWVLEFKRV